MSKKNAQKLVGRTIIIDLYEGDKDEEAKLRANKHNALLKSIIETSWPLENKYVFMTNEESSTALKKDKNKYAELIFHWGKRTRKGTTNTDFSFSTYNMTMYIGNKEICKISMLNYFINPLQLKIALRTLQDIIELANLGVNNSGRPFLINSQNTINNKIVNYNKDLLKDRVLLVPEELTSLNIDTLKSVYPYKAKIQSIKDIDTFVESNENVAVYILLWSDFIETYTLLIADYKSGKLIGQAPVWGTKIGTTITDSEVNGYPALFGKGVNFSNSLNFKLNKKHFRMLMKQQNK